MKSTGQFFLHQFTIHHGEYGKPVYLIPFGDVHRSSPMCHVEKWKDFCKWAELKGAYLLGMGDYDDILSSTERNMLRVLDMHESTVYSHENMVKDSIDEIVKELSFAKGKIIGLLEGNHYYVFQNGVTSTQYMCEKLNCRYLGTAAFIRLILRRDKHHSCEIKIFAHHGRGAGRTIGSSVNTLEAMIKIAEAEIYCQGHDHRKQVSMISRLALSENRQGDLRLINKKIVLVRTGSFLKGYEEGKHSYVVDGLYSPTDLGVVKIELTPTRKQEQVDKKTIEDRYIDVHASI